ncbi:GntR family transcriptional regulator [Niabella terrae]
MDSPFLKHVFNHLKLNPEDERSIYLQLADAILGLIKHGQLTSGQKLPSTRDLANLLKLNRVTVVKAFEELQMQGWLESFIGRGTFVSLHIPELEPKKLLKKPLHDVRKVAGFAVNNQQYLSNPYFVPTADLHLDDGYPDPRLAPLKELSRAYRNQLTRSGLYDRFGSYSFPDGSEIYRKTISYYLNETRGLKTSPRNILSIRGTLMGINLVCTALLFLILMMLSFAAFRDGSVLNIILYMPKQTI